MTTPRVPDSGFLSLTALDFKYGSIPAEDPYAYAAGLECALLKGKTSKDLTNVAPAAASRDYRRGFAHGKRIAEGAEVPDWLDIL